ncbi:MAG TPA: hypothetical protein VMX57_08180 [Planctomycetota bacterium]|nr:hypothetical protein [Planctomycetota bacterium]
MTDKSRVTDTSPEARRVQLEALRRLGVEGRLKATCALNRLTRELTKTGIRDRHPDYTEEQVEFALRRIMLGEKLFREVYPDVEVEP